MKRLCVLLWLACSAQAYADDILTVAVASNFYGTAERLAALYTAESGVEVRLSSGSTGKLYAQIVNGAPYDVYLAADVARPERLLASGFGIDDTFTVYARGVLVLASAEPHLDDETCLSALQAGSYRNLAIANPATAPYGAAAQSWLKSEGIWDNAKSRIIMGENISQTYQFVATRNATLGLIAASQLAAPKRRHAITCQFAVELPAPDGLQQAGVALSGSKQPERARSFMAFLGSAAAEDLILKAGYEAGGT